MQVQSLPQGIFLCQVVLLICQPYSLLRDSSPPATFECNFRVGWAQLRKAMHPIFSIRVQQFIARCWQEGIASRANVSAEAVVVRLTNEHVAGRIRLAELPVVGQVRTSYQAIGQSKDVPGGSAQG